MDGSFFATSDEQPIFEIGNNVKLTFITKCKGFSRDDNHDDDVFPKYMPTEDLIIYVYYNHDYKDIGKTKLKLCEDGSYRGEIEIQIIEEIETIDHLPEYLSFQIGTDTHKPEYDNAGLF